MQPVGHRASGIGHRASGMGRHPLPEACPWAIFGLVLTIGPLAVNSDDILPADMISRHQSSYQSNNSPGETFG
ncbi:hypothetical protein L484_003691 [Morus notabilis]|uniref:Uncharacterized protein n=1 Tax=Morus notabilis TaxID=981085 RepID=W9S7X9_9ROSA|nr:hypothetical protein L484_003691 [Morus notabilis]